MGTQDLRHPRSKRSKKSCMEWAVRHLDNTWSPPSTSAKEEFCCTRIWIKQTSKENKRSVCPKALKVHMQESNGTKINS